MTAEIFKVEKYSEAPSEYQDAAIEGICRILKANHASLEQVKCVKMGTTVATNALLQRKGASCALLITKGFKDLLRIGYQNRSDLFALNVKKPAPLYQCAIEIEERIDANGKIITPLNREQVENKLTRLKHRGIHSLAIVFLHSLQNSTHEEQVAAIAKSLGFSHVFCSSKTSSTPKAVRRGHTTVIDAYLGPVLQHYIDSVMAPLHHSTLYFMQSNGGLTRSEHFFGKNSILSGPAGGVVGAVKTATALGLNKIIGFDMGGTSTDVCHYRGEYERLYETEIDGVLVDVPMMNIHSVAAGGGSILHYQDKRLVVGPESAGANPGPACYRNGGPLTITDATVLLGKLPVESFPSVFGKGQLPDYARSEALFAELAQQNNGELTIYELAQGFIDIAVDNMSNAIKKISTDKGYALDGFHSGQFGGAGAQHACLFAEKLGITSILIPRMASVLSAFGIGCADIRLIEQQSIEASLQSLHTEEIEQLKNRLRDKLQHRHQTRQNLQFKIRYFLKYEGSDSIEITCKQPSWRLEKTLSSKSEHLWILRKKQAHSFRIISVEAIIQQRGKIPSPPEEKKRQSQRFFSDRQWHSVELKYLSECKAQEISGPSLIIAEKTTLVLETGWSAQVDKDYNVLLNRQQQRISQPANDLKNASPILLEIFNNAFMNCAVLMGSVLAQTAHSVNIKERRDYSCALFDKAGRLIANAPHMPVHLGSMSESVQQILHSQTLHEGDSYLLNNPYKGGTHLPDITVITPFFYGETLQFFVASRGHHADVGGLTPGSLPANSRSIEEEGIVIDDFLLVEHHQLHHEALLERFREGGARNPEQNLADIKAQLAANLQGIAELKQLIKTYGLDTLHAYVQHIQQNAQYCVEQVLSQLHSGSYTYHMDGGMHIGVDIHIENNKALIDFHRTSPPGIIFNAPARNRASVLYVVALDAA